MSTAKADHEHLVSIVRAGVRVFDLARPMVSGMAQSPNHPEYRLSMPRRHGDRIRPDGGSAANDLLETGTHVGTHIDALGHVSHCGLLHGDLDASEAQRQGRLSVHGVDEIPPIVTRGVLLDVAGLRGVEYLAGGTEVTPEDLEEAAARVGGINAGDVALIRTGWGRWWNDADAFVGRESGVPGVGELGARWLADRQPIAVGGDSIAFECLAPGAGHAVLPAHRVLLVEAGIFIVETMELEELAAAHITEFLFVLSPLPLVGATGSPVRPLAIVSSSERP